MPVYVGATVPSFPAHAVVTLLVVARVGIVILIIEVADAKADDAVLDMFDNAVISEFADAL